MSNSQEDIVKEARAYVGRRVEIPVHFDVWMQGARFGTVTGWRKGKSGVSAYVLVKMDHPAIKRRVKVWRLDWEYLRLL